ncbi:MAG TPA: CARDB domain-containing protein, partial [Thermoplasmata archaeon]|nr:CARDB domain-containing protein [Thermoplasmata archaeon]
MRIRKRRAAISSRTRDAVSEVIANILIIGMTATLFGGIFYFVANLKGPTEDSSIQMSSSLESDRDFAVGARIWLNITHLGGRTIGAGVTDISIQVDGVAAIYVFSDGGLGQTWSVGESWSLVVQNDANTTLPGILNVASAVFATISDTEKSTVIWAGHVFLKLNAFGPRIDGGVDPSPVSESSPFLLWARIVELEGQEIVSATVVSTDLGILTPVNLTFNFARDRWETPAPSGMPEGKYSFTVSASDIAGKTSTKTIYFTVGDITGAGPDLLVDSGFIIFSDESPIRGDEIVVTAVVFNLGGTATGANCTFYLNAIVPANILSYVNITTIAPGGGVDAKLNWKAQPGGLHTILVSCATYPNPGDDIDPGNNQAGRQISVLPRILLVDDDQEPDTSFASETIYLKSAMDATDFQYDVSVVGSGIGPDYDSGATPLQDYDVVVWTTGQRTTGTLIATDVGKSILCGLDNGEDDVGHLTTFMCNGGRVWLVGEGILNEAGTTPWPSPVRAVSFLNAYFGFTPDAIPDTLAPALLQSTGTPLWLSKPPVDFATTLRWSPDGTDRITSNLVPASAHTTLRDKAFPADAYGVNFTGLGLGGAQFRSIFMSIGFATMRDSGDQAQTAYHYLLWLSGLPKKLGHDVAISAATVDPPAPRFQQDVRFNLTVRNNGGFDEANFEVLLTDIYQGVETQIATVTVPTIAQLGGEYRISQVWRPDRLGVHTLRAIADWNNKIVESNENNNEISKLIFSGQVVVGFNLL